MKSAAFPPNEHERLRWLNELDILDTVEEQSYDDLTALAAAICDTPIALVSLLDSDRQWFKSHHGLDARETPRELAFCAHAILQNEVFIVNDSEKDDRFFDNPLVTQAPNVKFYAGAPLVIRDNIRLGTLCVIDHQAREFTEKQQESLNALARQVTSLLELRFRVKELQDLDNVKDEFISMVSHELRTPLTSINGALSLMTNSLKEKVDESSANLIDIAYRNSDRLLMLVNDILDIAKLESGKLQFDFRKVDVLDLMAQAIDLNQMYCERCGVSIALETELQEGAAVIQADSQRLLQVLCNFISNAAKFSFKGDCIKAQVQLVNQFIVVSVVDHGPGIPLHKQAQVFQKFSQLGGATESNGSLPGTGLGLSISKQIIEQHGGKIGFESVPGELTRFYFSLPNVAN